jgi:hypothetical protein
MNFTSKIKLGLTIIIVGLLFSFSVKAATLELALEKDIVNATDDIGVLVTINSEGQEINTAQSVISFPSNLLSVSNIDRSNSTLTFWLEEPSFDNGEGTIRFVGGSTSGLNGASLKVLRIGFKVKGSGTGRLSITDGAITSSDGTGSNVYNTAKGLDIDIPSTSQFEAVQVERTVRETTLAKELPALLGVEIPFYPDSTKWNNHSASFQAKWKISSDTTRAAVIINNNPNFTPPVDPEALSGSKIFPALADGVWYLHLRLENNIGWSPTLHYRLAIDTTPPTAFKITSDSGLKTDSSMPTISFATSDLTSGIDFYTVRLNGETATTTTLTSYTFTPLLPGVHQLVIVATDKAGNSISQAEKLEILPIVSPTITSVTRRVILNEGQMVAVGIASPEVEVIVQVRNTDMQIVFEKIVPVDSNGNWGVTVDKDLSSGNYNLLATARDKSFASSFPAVSDSIIVKPKPVLAIGSFELSQTWFFIDLIIILLISFGAGWFTYYKWRAQLNNRVIIAQRDVANTVDSLKTNIDKLIKNYSDNEVSDSDLAEMKYLLTEMSKNLEKSRRYLLDNIKEISD